MTPIDIGYRAIENALCMFALRDEFAAKALQGILPRDGAINPKQDAQFAYLLADAMLAARTEPTQ